MDACHQDPKSLGNDPKMRFYRFYKNIDHWYELMIKMCWWSFCFLWNPCIWQKSGLWVLTPNSLSQTDCSILHNRRISQKWLGFLTSFFAFWVSIIVVYLLNKFYLLTGLGIYWVCLSCPNLLWRLFAFVFFRETLKY